MPSGFSSLVGLTDRQGRRFVLDFRHIFATNALVAMMFCALPWIICL
ncbi:hypothetical protein NB701_002844 [Pantoea ananatis]|nr:hypothetical protein [Pantoea ananatis]